MKMYKVYTYMPNRRSFVLMKVVLGLSQTFLKNYEVF